MTTKEGIKANKADIAFTKEQLRQSARFAEYRDALDVILEESKRYTLEEVKALLRQFMKGKVK